MSIHLTTGNTVVKCFFFLLWPIQRKFQIEKELIYMYIERYEYKQYDTPVDHKS